MSSPLPVSAFAVRPRQMRLVQLAPHLTAAVLPARACLALRGEVQIAVAWGAADADGAVLGADWQRVVRPGSGGVACTVWPVKHQGAHGKRPTVSTAEEAALHKAISLQSDAGPDGCVLLLRAACILAPLLARLGGPMAATFAALHSSARSGEQQLLPPGVAIDAVGTVFPQAWWEFINAVVARVQREKQQGLTIVVCGPKDAGKSSIIRLLLNRLLSSSARGACLLDCDTGQTEMNPPGMIALHRIRTPLLSAAFAQQQDPAFMLHFGEKTPRDAPDDYIDAVRRTADEARRQFPMATLVVNTPGWVKGMGLVLLGDIIRVTRPSLVVELATASTSRNVSPSLSHGLPPDSYLPPRVDVAPPAFDVEVLPDVSEGALVTAGGGGGTQLVAAELRDLSVATHLFGSPPMGVATQPVIEVPLGSVILGCMEEDVEPSEIFVALNGALVALCSGARRGDTSVLECSPGIETRVLIPAPVLPCIGYGLVRSVDLDRGVLYLVTPCATSPRLADVTALIRGCVNPSPFLYLSQARRPGAGVPYVSDDFGDTTAAGRGARSTRTNLARRSGGGPTQTTQ